MKQLLLFGVLCAIAPWLLARLHFLLGSLTRPLVYLLAAAQALAVPVMVAIDPDISFGSDAYSLGAGIMIALVGSVEIVILIGTAIGVFAATTYLNKRDDAFSSARLEAIYSEVAATQPLTSDRAMRTDVVSERPWLIADAEPFPTSLAPDPVSAPAAAPTTEKQSVALTVIGAFLCFNLALAGAGMLIEGLTAGNFDRVRYFGSVEWTARPISFLAVCVLYLAATCATTWGTWVLVNRLRRSAD